MSKVFVPTADGLIVTVRLTPGAAQDAIDGIEERGGTPMLKARVRARPREGEANAALISLLAKRLRVPARRVEIISGATARVKRVKISGENAALARAIESVAAGDVA